MKSEGQRQLRNIVARTSLLEVAKKTGVARGTIRRLVNDDGKCKTLLRNRLAKAWGIPVRLWDTAPLAEPADNSSQTHARTRPPIVKAGEPQGESPGPIVPVDTASSVNATIGRLQKRLDALMADPNATAKEQELVERSLHNALRLKARLEAPKGPMTAASIVRSPAWQDVMRTAIEALRPFPGAFDALANALEALP